MHHSEAARYVNSIGQESKTAAMTTVTIQKAKAELSKLIEQAARGEEVIIARGNPPVARLVPYVPEQPKRASAR